MRSHGIVPLNLGPYVMRLETAVIAGLAVLRRMCVCGVLAVACAMLAGCGEKDITKHPLMLKANQYRKDGRMDLAEQHYRRLIALKPEYPQTYLALAELNDEEFNQPAKAIYFYDEYLNLIPESHPSREAVTKMRDGLVSKARESLVGAVDKKEYEMVVRQRDKYKKLVVTQNEKVKKLQHELSTRNNYQADAPRNAGATSFQKTTVHVVRSGDSLSGIAKKYHVSVAEIRNANGLGIKSILRIGQIIKIPR